MRPRQKIPFHIFGDVYLPELTTMENGVAEVKFVNQVKDRHLPDPSVTDLDALLSAGVDVKRVNSKIFKPMVIVTDLTDEKAQTSETNTNEGEN